MTKEADWIATRIGESHKLQSSVTAAAVARMEVLLRGELKDGPLSGAELERIAGAFIADVMPDAQQAPGTPT